MAKILLSDLIDDIAGKFAGSVFQRTVSGLMMRRWVAPRDPKYVAQQFARASMSFIRRSWNEIDPAERLTWVDMDLTRPAVSNFIASNQVIARAGQPLLAEFFLNPLDPIGDLVISQLDVTNFDITFNVIPVPLPEGQYLNIYATRMLSAGTSQVSPNSYAWIQTFPPGTEFATDQSIFSAYVARYGTPVVGQTVSLKATLVNVGTGNYTSTLRTKPEPVLA